MDPSPAPLFPSNVAPAYAAFQKTWAAKAAPFKRNSERVRWLPKLLRSTVVTPMLTVIKSWCSGMAGPFPHCLPIGCQMGNLGGELTAQKSQADPLGGWNAVSLSTHCFLGTRGGEGSAGHRSLLVLANHLSHFGVSGPIFVNGHGAVSRSRSWYRPTASLAISQLSRFHTERSPGCFTPCYSFRTLSSQSWLFHQRRPPFMPGGLTSSS